MVRALLSALSGELQRRLLAERGLYPLSGGADEIRRRLETLALARPEILLEAARARACDLAELHHALFGGRWPGRSEALLAVARALGLSLPDDEYALPEDRLDALLERARAANGRRIPLRGQAGHKGRVGDGVERLLTGGKVSGRMSDHPAAEIKSVPVRGDQVIERVKLGVVSARSNPLAKCDRVLFVFVEQRGRDHFVRGHHLEAFDGERWRGMWRDGFLVETAAGSTAHPARGLYLTPKWFRVQAIWPAQPTGR
ncbi:MAG TPA: hypothetical protein VII38_02280 [Polyangia bacterium]|jgi:hypothetical protein